MSFFSIITATKNASAVLPRLLSSLAVQTYRDFNLIIQDAKSTDSSHEIIESFRPQLPQVLLDISSDSGIYDAWNKALALHKKNLGKWIIFLGADDQLAGTQVLQSVAGKLTNSSHMHYAAGSVQYTDSNGALLNSYFNPDVKNFSKIIPYRMPLINSALFHYQPHLINYPFDTRFHIAGDYDQIVRAWESSSKCIELDMVVSYMALGGVSTGPKHADSAYEEMCYVRKKYFFVQKYFVLPLEKIDKALDRSGHKSALRNLMARNKYVFYIWDLLRRIKRKIL